MNRFPSIGRGSGVSKVGGVGEVTPDYWNPSTPRLLELLLSIVLLFLELLLELLEVIPDYWNPPTPRLVPVAKLSQTFQLISTKI